MPCVRILLADDADDFIKSAVDFLSRDPRVEIVGQARDGGEAVQMALTLAPDIVLMDLIMPVSGLGATLRIKVAPKPPRVFIVSIYDDAGIRRTAMSTGADGFIPKSRFAEQVMTEIDRFISGVDALPRTA